MPLVDLKIAPGVDIQKTQTLNEGGWSDSQLIRFKDGMAQKIGGWEQIEVTPIYGSTRALHAFADLDGNTYLAAGTEQELVLKSAYGTQNITPFKQTDNVTPNFSTIIGSNIITVVDTSASSAGLVNGDWINIVSPIYISGLTLSGTYQISHVSSGGTSYQIVANANAAGTINNSGSTALFSTTNGSTTVVVTAPNHGLWTGDQYAPAIAVSVGGITVSGLYTITYIDLNSFSIEESTATSSASAYMNSGNVRIGYLLGTGLNNALADGSYGAGPYGYGPYGEGAGLDYLQTVALWSLDNWGEQLIANRHAEGIYVWAPPPAPGNVATVIANAPLYANQALVAMPARILVALGAETAGIRDPLLVRWSDVENYNDWTATAINQAGSYRLSTGSAIIGGILGSNKIYIWTDIGLWEMMYISTPYVFGFDQIATNCGLIGPHAVARVNDEMLWMSQRQFYIFNGSGVTEIPCPVWDQVFQNINELQSSKVTAATNSYFGEVWWFYPSKDSEENDSYVKYNMGTNSWDYGLLNRTAWTDQSVLGAPIAADSTSNIYQHETGNDDSGLPINSYIETGYILLAEGDQFIYVDQIIPDIKFGIPTSNQNGTVYATVKMVDYPTDEPRVYGPFPMNKLTPFISMRARGRQMSLRFESDDLGSFWRLGKIRYRGAPAGRR